MQAEEARSKATSVVENKAANQMAVIRLTIERAVNQGQFSVNFYDPLMLDVLFKLEEEGYEVYEHSDQRDGTTVTIKW